MYDVVIAGCGPTGAMLAAELRLHQVRVLVVEQETEPAAYARIVSLHIRSLELLAMRGLLDRIRARGRQRPAAGFFASIPAPPPAGLDTPYPFLIGLPQPVLVDILSSHAASLGAEIRPGSAVTGFSPLEDGVTVSLADGSEVQTRYLVGCDGARSAVRKLLGVDFPGEPSRNFTLMGEIALETTPSPAQLAADRRFSVRPIGDGVYQVVLPGASDTGEPPTLDDFRERLRAIAGSDFGAHAARWMSRFGDATRLAARYRVGPVLLAGDAAHIHPPIGGQGLNLGLQDAMNLGWKLAGAVRGWAPAGLLDSYQAERRPVAAAVLDNTRAQTELLSPSPGAQAARRLLTELIALDEVNRYLIEKIAALDIRYDFGSGPDLLGRRLPDVDGVYSRLHRGRGLLLDRTSSLSVGSWSDRVDHLDDPAVPLDVPALLMRPDGHVAWIGDSQADLDDHLGRWFGAAVA